MSSTQRRVDLGIGLALSLLAAAVLWSARGFPVVPGQKLGAGFLPMLVGAGLLACGLALLWRGLRPARAGGPPQPGATGRPAEHYGSAAVIVAVVAGYLLLADRVGFLIVAPLGLMAMFRAFRVAWLPTLAWALGGTLLVHLAFYKLLRVPLPWGVLRPFY
ncbi:MAG: tripartite tricarboxylate transporter TctB family protein [Rubrivivax sp.]|nr:tripartite tricarboxylate transporter TctB family protein [Rubrivivax sp.]